jgi:hypothetical protein
MLFGRHRRDLERPGDLPTAMAFSNVNDTALVAG